MEFKKIINLLCNKTNNQPKLGQKTGLKQMMNHKERVTKIIKLDLKL